MNIACIILAGGKGTRLTDVLSDRPKPFAMVAGKPFIEWVISYFKRHGVQNFIISLGHLAPIAQKYFDDRKNDGTTITTVVEQTPLGTGGAFLYAAQMAEADVYILTNGDSLLLANIERALALLALEDVDGVLIGRQMEDVSRYGTLRFDKDGKITGFAEKKPGSGVINGGVYLFKRRLLEKFPKSLPMSIEQEGIPTLIEQGAHVLVSMTEAPFLDIGLPETLAQAEIFIQNNFSGSEKE